MASHGENLEDLASKNKGVAASLNRYCDWVCKSGVTESSLVPKNFTAQIKDYIKTTAGGNSVAMNFSYLVLSLGSTVSVGTPGAVCVELINPNLQEPYQTLAGQTLYWEPGSGKPCLMVFSIQHQLPTSSDPFKVRVTNNGIPTAEGRAYARCHAYWGFDLSTKIRQYKSESARRIDIDVGYQKTPLNDLKRVKQYISLTLDSSRMGNHPQITTAESVNVIPQHSRNTAYVVNAPAMGAVEAPLSVQRTTEWVKSSVDGANEPHKLASKDTLSVSSRRSKGSARSYSNTLPSDIPIKRTSRRQTRRSSSPVSRRTSSLPPAI
jgi:hypothetical protein